MAASSASATAIDISLFHIVRKTGYSLNFSDEAILKALAEEFADGAHTGSFAGVWKWVNHMGVACAMPVGGEGRSLGVFHVRANPPASCLVCNLTTRPMAQKGKESICIVDAKADWRFNKRGSCHATFLEAAMAWKETAERAGFKVDVALLERHAKDMDEKAGAK